MVLFEGIPFWVWWVVVGVILAIIYFWLMDENTKAIFKNFIYQYGFYIGLLLAWLFMRQYLGYFTEEDWFDKQANTYALFILFLFLIAKNFLGVLRYQSTQAICDNRSGSCTKYQRLGEHVVMNIGTTDADGIAWPFGHETWVVPYRHFKKINQKTNSPSQIMCETLVINSDLLETPQMIHDFISSTPGYNKENVYYGEYSQKELSDITETDGEGAEKRKKGDVLKENEMKLRDHQRMINESREMLKGKTSAIKGFVSDASAIQKKAKGESLIVQQQGGGDNY